jgi:hypothetical protein
VANTTMTSFIASILLYIEINVDEMEKAFSMQILVRKSSK